MMVNAAMALLLILAHYHENQYFTATPHRTYFSGNVFIRSLADLLGAICGLWASLVAKSGK